MYGRSFSLKRKFGSDLNAFVSETNKLDSLEGKRRKFHTQ